jgi:hypothetical protein
VSGADDENGSRFGYSRSIDRQIGSDRGRNIDGRWTARQQEQALLTVMAVVVLAGLQSVDAQQKPAGPGQ